MSEKEVPNQDLLSVNDLASMFKVHVRTIRQLIKNGSLPKPIMVGSVQRWRKEEIEKLLRK